MYDDFDDDRFLAPEALLSLHFENDDGELGRADALERNARARLIPSDYDLDALEDDLFVEDDLEEQPYSALVRPLMLS